MPRRIATTLLSSEPVTRFEKALYPEAFTGGGEVSGPRSSSEVGAKMHQKVLDKYQDPKVVAKMDAAGTEMVTKGKGTKGINEKLMRKLKRKDTLKARKGKYLKMKSKLLKSKNKLDDKTLLLKKPKNKLMTKLRGMVKSRDMSIDIHIDLKGIKACKAKCKINR